MQMIENILAMVIYTDYFVTNWLFELIMLITKTLQIFSWVWKCCKCSVSLGPLLCTSMQMNLKKCLVALKPEQVCCACRTVVFSLPCQDVGITSVHLTFCEWCGHQGLLGKGRSYHLVVNGLGVVFSPPSPTVLNLFFPMYFHLIKWCSFTCSTRKEIMDTIWTPLSPHYRLLSPIELTPCLLISVNFLWFRTPKSLVWMTAVASWLVSPSPSCNTLTLMDKGLYSFQVFKGPCAHLPTGHRMEWVVFPVFVHFTLACILQSIWDRVLSSATSYRPVEVEDIP